MNGHNQRPRSRTQSWARPHQGLIKMNFDASWTTNNASGVVIFRDHHGKVLRIGHFLLKASSTPFTAEALALLEGLCMAVKMKTIHLVVEGKCLALINAIRKT